MARDVETRNRQSIRLQNFDYAGNAVYFLTLCAQGRNHLFGEIEDGFMTFNAVGAMVEREWLRSALLRAELQLHSFVTMPNHLHGLIAIAPVVEPAVDGAEKDARHAPSRRIPRSLGSFVTGVKAATTRQFNLIAGNEGRSLWQRGYYEHVIRDERDFNRIGGYIANNPMNWTLDRENANRTGDPIL